MVLNAISPTSFLYEWNSKTTTFIASLSFAIYLTHKCIIHTTNKLLEILNIDCNVTMMISIFFCIFEAYLLHLTIEKLFMNLRKKSLEQNKTNS